MFMLRGASIATWDTYANNIRGLVVMYPHVWDRLVMAGDVAHCEHNIWGYTTNTRAMRVDEK